METQKAMQALPLSRTELQSMDFKGEYMEHSQPSFEERRQQYSTAETTRQLLYILRDKEIVFQSLLPAPFVLLMTNATGTIIYSLDKLQPPVGHSRAQPCEVGTDLASPSCGLNAVSLAIARQHDAYVQGDEPWIKSWIGWAGFVVPLKNGSNEIIGFLALYAEPKLLGIEVYPFVKIISSLLEKEFNQRTTRWSYSDFSEYLSNQLERYELTPRERQVAALWMMDYDYKQIGRAIGISENTVRVITSRLNSKLQVNSKASLILRVLGAI